MIDVHWLLSLTLSYHLCCWGCRLAPPGLILIGPNSKSSVNWTMFFLHLSGPHAFNLHPVTSRAAVPSQLVRSCFRSCLPSCLLPGPSASSRLLVSLLVSPSPPCRCAVSVCHSTCLRLVSLFALLSHFVSTFSGLVWLSLPSCIPSSLRLTICLLCLSSCQEPSETWLSA